MKSDHRANLYLKYGNSQAPSVGGVKLITKQINGEIVLNEISHMPYQINIQIFIKSFDEIQFEHMPRLHNRTANTLATLAP